ncbi:type IV pilus modification PilV family protein [endosymbiont of unidentified scaly snail isolate Monju]|uniref:type IV pilus modification PilV family protein n=1 Tax=endosymbiont of unidentified scaly snail isolate Monju TaxID=1248727 RepID=UPI0005B7E26F
MNRIVHHGRLQAGTTLIEVLVSILVVSIGLLGLAGLFANSLKSTNEGYMYSQVNRPGYSGDCFV